MSTALLSTLRTPLVKSDLSQRVLAFLAADGMPTSDWAPTASGGLENGLIDMVSGTIVDLGAAGLAEAIKAGFLGYASGDWMTLLAKRFYDLDRLPATYSIQAITLTCAAAAGPYNFAAGELWAIGAGGNRYQSLDAGSLLPGKALVLRFQAENAGASYNDAAGTITTLVTSLPGVTINNAKTLTPIPAGLAVGGTSTGTLTPFLQNGSPPITADRFRVKITRSGQAAGAPGGQYSVSIDDGVTWTTPQTTTSFSPAPANCSLIFKDSALTNPSFVLGDIFYFSNTALLQQGSDAESDERLSGRCRSRWLTLSDVPTPGTVDLWCRLASPEVNRVKVTCDQNAANTALVYLGSSAGRVGPASVLTVQAYIMARLDSGETVNVTTVDLRKIVVTGNVQVPRVQLAAVQAQAELNWTAYLASLPIGGTVILQKLEQAIMDAGARDVSSLNVAGGSPNLVMGDHEVAVPADGTTLSSSLRWDPI